MLDRLKKRVLRVVRRERNCVQTIVFADIAGSTALYESLGDARARDLVCGRLEQMEEIVRQNGGRVVKSLGDGILCVFAETGPAVTAGLALAQGRPDQELKVCVGLHRGDTLVVGRDVFGDAVNTAARIAELAKACEVLMSRTVLDAMPTGYERMVRAVQPVSVKGKKEPLELFAYLHRADGDESATLPTKRTRTHDRIAVRLRWRDHELRADAARPRLTLGRAEENDLSIDAENVSRTHAVIEVRTGKVVLSDQSSNGTLIVMGDGKRLTIHREQAPLLGTGRFFLGGEGPDDVDGIDFAIEE